MSRCPEFLLYMRFKLSLFLSIVALFASNCAFAQPLAIPQTVTQAQKIIQGVDYPMDTVEGIWSVGGTVCVLVDGKVVNEIHQPDVRKMCTLKIGDGVFESYELFDERYAYLYDTGGDTVLKVAKNDSARMQFRTTSKEQWYNYKRFFHHEQVWGYCKINITQIDTFEYSYIPPKEVTAWGFAGYNDPDATLRFDVKWTRIWPSTIQKPIPEDTAQVAEIEKPQPEVRYNSGGIPASVNKRKVKVWDDIPVETEYVELRVWDKSREDGDTISIYYNGMWVLKNFGLTNDKKAIKIKVRPNKGNTLVFYAENLGSVPPNTAALSVWDGTKETEMVVSSDMGTCAAVKLKLPE